MIENKWKKALSKALAREYEDYPSPAEKHVFSTKFEKSMCKLIIMVKSAKNNRIRRTYKKRQD